MSALKKSPRVGSKTKSTPRSSKPKKVIKKTAPSSKRTTVKKTLKPSSQVSNNFKRPKKIYLNFSRVFSGPHQIARIMLTHRLPPNTAVLMVVFIVVFALSIIIANSGNLTAEQEPKVQITKNFPTSRPINKAKEVTYQKIAEQEPKVLGATTEEDMDALLESAE